jgi:hypothetical protein
MYSEQHRGRTDMIKEQNCFNYFPGDITKLLRIDLTTLLLRDGRKPKRINGMWLGGPGDNQRQTVWNYIYASDNLLGGI